MAAIIAPPTMLQAWILPGVEMSIPSDVPKDKQRELHMIFDSYGYTGVVATNCEQGYDREICAPVIRSRAVTVIEEISAIRRRRASGPDTSSIPERLFRDEARTKTVGWMTFRVLKFIPAQQQAAVAEDSPSGGSRKAHAHPARTRAFDNEWWWEGRFERENS